MEDLLNNLTTELKIIDSTLSGLTPGMEQYEILLNQRKLIQDQYNSIMDRNLKEKELEQAKVSDERTKIEKIIDFGLRAVGLALSVAVPIWGYTRSMKFEQTDMLTTSAGKDAQKKVFNFKFFK